MHQPGSSPRVVVIGAGFGGLQAAKALAEAAPAAMITLVDRHNYHTFSPLLYQVATAVVEPEEIAYPVRAIFRRRPRVHVRVAEVSAIDLEQRTVLAGGETLVYDYLIVATGSRTNFFNIQGAEQSSFGLKDLPEALALRNHLLQLFEQAGSEADAARRRTLLTIVIAGGGPTGVELAGAIAELSRAIIRDDFPAIDPREVRVVLVEAGDRLLAAFRPRLSRAAERFLSGHGVEVRLATPVKSAETGAIHLADGSSIASQLLVWAAGVRADTLAAQLTKQLGASGRVPVLPTLQLPDHSEVYVIGDMADLREGDGGAPLPMLAPVAMQEGVHAGKNVALQVAGRAPRPFHYVDRGTMATLGRSHAVAQIGPVSLTGFVAWAAWLGLHLIELIGFRNRALVLINWIWDYLFSDRGARIIFEPADRDKL